MFGKRSKIKNKWIDTLIGVDTVVAGDVRFRGELAVLGRVAGDVSADEAADHSVLNLHESGRVEGEIRVPNVVINGEVVGNVYATEHLQLAANARVNGNVYYHLIQMDMGAEVNGSLVHIDQQDQPLRIGHEPAPAEGADPVDFDGDADVATAKD